MAYSVYYSSTLLCVFLVCCSDLYVLLFLCFSFSFSFSQGSYLQLHCWTYFLLATEESCIVVSPSLSTSTLLELSSLSLLSSLAPSCCMTYDDGSAHLFALYFSTSILIVPVLVCQRQQNRP